MELWKNGCMYRESIREKIMGGQLDVLGAWLRGICGGTVGITDRVGDREFWRECWMYYVYGCYNIELKIYYR